MYFVPANLSCFFTIHPHSDPRWAGTCGVGFTATKGVTATIKQTNQRGITMSYNGIDCLIKPVVEICQMLNVQDAHIQLTSPFPLGAGFGMSGASTLATAYALQSDMLQTIDNTTLKTNTSLRKKLAILAHTAEATHKTGLGDIVNQYYRGFLIKTTSSAHFKAERIPIDQNTISYKICAPKDAQAGLEYLNKDILNKAGEKALSRIQNEMATNQPVSLHRIFHISKQFCEEAGLLTNSLLSNTIHEIEKNGGAATRILLGNAVMSTTPFPGSQEITISD